MCLQFSHEAQVFDDLVIYSEISGILLYLEGGKKLVEGNIFLIFDRNEFSSSTTQESSDWPCAS